MRRLSREQLSNLLHLNLHALVLQPLKNFIRPSRPTHVTPRDIPFTCKPLHFSHLFIGELLNKLFRRVSCSVETVDKLTFLGTDRWRSGIRLLFNRLQLRYVGGSPRLWCWLVVSHAETLQGLLDLYGKPFHFIGGLKSVVCPLHYPADEGFLRILTRRS